MSKLYYKTGAFLFSAMLMASANVTDVYAQTGDDVTFGVVASQGYTLSRISDNGRYGVGYHQTWDGVLSVWYDFETSEVVLADSLVLKDVGNDGTAAGLYLDLVNGGIELPIIWKDGETKFLPRDESFTLGSAVNTLSVDGKYALGYFFRGWTGKDCMVVPVMWDLEGEVTYDRLPIAEEDWQELPPQQIQAYDMSGDMSVILGRETCKTGFVKMLAMWKLNGSGEYEYQVLGSDTYFDKTQEHPGQTPSYDEMVTADPTSEPDLYKEQLDAWYAAMIEYQEKFEAYFTGLEVVSASNITENGKYFCGVAEYKVDNQLVNTRALLVKTDNPDEFIMLDEGTRGLAVTNDGTYFYRDTNTNEVFVCNAEDATIGSTFADYMREEYGVNLSEHLREGGYITSVYPTPDGSSIMFTETHDMDGTLQYFAYAPGRKDVKEAIVEKDLEVSMDGNMLVSNARLRDVKVFSANGQLVYEGASEGSLDLSFLGEGIYIVKGKADNGTFKVVKAVVK